MLQACSFLSNPFLEFCFSTPLFLPSYCSTSSSRHLTLRKLQCVALEPRYFGKGDLAEHFASTFSFVMPISHESEQRSFRSVPSSAGFIRLILCEASYSIFRVLLRPCQALRAVCVRMFTLSAAWPVLHIALLFPPLFVCDSGHASRSGRFVFECSFLQLVEESLIE